MTNEKAIEFYNRLKEFAANCEDIPKTERDTTMPKESVRCPPGESHLFDNIIIWHQ